MAIGAFDGCTNLTNVNLSENSKFVYVFKNTPWGESIK